MTELETMLSITDVADLNDALDVIAELRAQALAEAQR